MKQLTTCSIAFGVCLSVLAVATTAGEREPSEERAATDVDVQRFRMNPYHANIGRIISVDADGRVQVAKVANPRFALTRGLAGRPALTEGFYLGFVAGEFVVSTEDTRLVRIQVIEVGETDQIFTQPRHKLTEDYITGRFG